MRFSTESSVKKARCADDSDSSPCQSCRRYHCHQRLRQDRLWAFSRHVGGWGDVKATPIPSGIDATNTTSKPPSYERIYRVLCSFTMSFENKNVPACLNNVLCSCSLEQDWPPHQKHSPLRNVCFMVLLRHSRRHMGWNFTLLLCNRLFKRSVVKDFLLTCLLRHRQILSIRLTFLRDHGLGCHIPWVSRLIIVHTSDHSEVVCIVFMRRWKRWWWWR